MECIVEIISPSLPYQKKRVHKHRNIGTKRWGMKRIVDRVQPPRHKMKKKKKEQETDRGSSDPNAQRKMVDSNGEELGGCVGGVDDPSRDAHSRNSTMLDRCLLLHDDIPFLSYSNQSDSRTHKTTHTHIAQNHAEKKHLANDPPTTGSIEREDGVFRHCFSQLHVAVLGSLKPKFSDFPDLVLDHGEHFQSCPRTSVTQMWTACNTIHFTFKAMPQEHGTTCTIVAHSCEVPLQALLHKHIDTQKKSNLKT